MAHEIQLYQIFDTQAQAALGIIMKAYRDGIAVRMFTELLAGNKDNEVSKYPNDFNLLHLGKQDMETGAITPHPAGPQIVYTGRQFTDEIRRAAAETAAAASPRPDGRNYNDALRETNAEAADRGIGPDISDAIRSRKEP